MNYNSTAQKVDVETQIENTCDWILALADNGFAQCRGEYQEAENDAASPMCCLGVASHLANLKCTWLNVTGDPFISAETGSKALTATFGLSHNGQHECVEMNDGEELSFSQIASKLVAHPKRFFSAAVAQGVKEKFWYGEK
jgi:hypothetical protein